MQVHSPWRDEIGWMLAMVGVAMVAFAVIDHLTWVKLNQLVEMWVLVLVVGVLLVVIGFGLHLEALPRRRERGEQTPVAHPPRDAGAE